MRRQRWLLSLCILPFFFIAVLSSAQARQNLPAIIKKIRASTVVIMTYNSEGEPLTQGSGFFVSKDGDIITNHHVIQCASRVEVKTAKGRTYAIKSVVAEDKEADLIRIAVDIPRNAVHPLPLSTTIPEIGERIIVIGSPLGLEQTVSDGIVSAIRENSESAKIIQITAPISPGSSGSPVINMKGEIIGVATSTIVNGQSLNFAISSENIAALTPPGKRRTFTEWRRSKEREWFAATGGLRVKVLRFENRGDYEQALSYCKEMLKKDPCSSFAYSHIGWCNSEHGRYEEAIEAYKQSIRLGGRDYLNLGNIYKELRHYKEAIEAYKHEILIFPHWDRLYLMLGQTYEEANRYDEAIDAYKHAISMKGDAYAWGHYNLANAYFNSGRYREAIEVYGQLIHMDPDFLIIAPEIPSNLLVAYSLLGYKDQAIEKLINKVINLEQKPIVDR